VSVPAIVSAAVDVLIPPSAVVVACVKKIVTVLPAPLVSAPPIPRISRVLAIGIASPVSVTKSVAICGCVFSTSRIPAWLITHPL